MPNPCGGLICIYSCVCPTTVQFSGCGSRFSDKNGEIVFLEALPGGMFARGGKLLVGTSVSGDFDQYSVELCHIHQLTDPKALAD